MPKRTVKRNKSLRRTKRRTNGGGWSDFQPTNATSTKASFDSIAVSPGNQIHYQFAGEGKDCTGNPMSIRPGHIAGYTPKGLPGMGGGSRGKRNKKAWKRRGGSSCGAAPMATDNKEANSINPLPSVMKDQVMVSAPGVPAHQAGGRYGMFPEMGPLNPVNGVGTTPGPFGRIPCEVGTYNPLNPNPNDIQRLSTAPLTPPFVTRTFSGGAAIPAGSGLAASAANFPTVQVGDVNSMRYYAPTAGYRNDFMTFRAPAAVPGLTIQTPYDAKAFNQACIKTSGGSRKKKGGADPIAFGAGKFTPVTINEVWTRKDFDGSNQGLPVKFGGKRKTRRVTKKQRKQKKQKKQKKSKKQNKSRKH